MGWACGHKHAQILSGTTIIGEFFTNHSKTRDPLHCFMHIYLSQLCSKQFVTFKRDFLDLLKS